MFRSNLFYVYIIQCADDSFYTGMTNWLERRMKEHHEGSDDTKYTAQRLPLKLVYYEWHQYVFNAIRREKQIKNWSRAKKIALINGDFEELKKLSRCNNHASHSNCPDNKVRRIASNSDSLTNHTIIHNLSSLKYNQILPTGSSNGYLENQRYFLSLRFATYSSNETALSDRAEPR